MAGASSQLSPGRCQTPVPSPQTTWAVAVVMNDFCLVLQRTCRGGFMDESEAEKQMAAEELADDLARKAAANKGGWWQLAAGPWHVACPRSQWHTTCSSEVCPACADLTSRV